eukprot:GHUV01051250.1.p1 GENE.GHUV01051250.1~~GHUV01051250.1.p1  ORF type:complete len:113 (+),score=6.57 GHUV01051250.1:207-545(+)
MAGAAALFLHHPITHPCWNPGDLVRLLVLVVLTHLYSAGTPGPCGRYQLHIVSSRVLPSGLVKFRRNGTLSHWSETRVCCHIEGCRSWVGGAACPGTWVHVAAGPVVGHQGH